jgi:hypothetical protein
MARTPRKDRFVNIVFVVWCVVNFVLYFIGGMDYVAIGNLGFLLFLVSILRDKKVMAWLNQKD